MEFNPAFKGLITVQPGQEMRMAGQHKAYKSTFVSDILQSVPNNY